MRAPAGLSPIARGAFNDAAGAVQSSGRDPAGRRVVAPLRIGRGPPGNAPRIVDAEGRPATVLGARGQTIAHPTLAEIRSLEAHLDDALKRLGVLLAPPSRAGHPMGLGQAPDRRPPATLVGRRTASVRMTPDDAAAQAVRAVPGERTGGEGL